MDTNINNIFNLTTLSPGAERLLLTLVYYAGANSVCFPSQETLMRALKISKKTVLRRYVNELYNANLVSYQKSFTSRKLASGKTTPMPQIKYFVVNNQLYYSNGDDSNRLYINFSARKLPAGTFQKVTGTIHNSYKNSTEPLQQKNQEEKQSSYKVFIIQFNRKYGTNLFPTFGKQAAAIKRILASYSESDIWECAEWLSNNKWWREHGFDFTSIQSQIGKYKMSDRSDNSPLKGYRHA